MNNKDCELCKELKRLKMIPDNSVCNKTPLHIKAQNDLKHWYKK